MALSLVYEEIIPQLDKITKWPYFFNGDCSTIVPERRGIAAFMLDLRESQTPVFSFSHQLKKW